MRYWLYRVLYNQYFLNVQGIKAFAERCMNVYVEKDAVKKALSITSHINILYEELKKRVQDFQEYSEVNRMDDGSFSLTQKKSRRLKWVVFIIIAFEIFLNYISTLIFIQGDGLLYFIVRWGLAIILALGAMMVTDGILANLLPNESVWVKKREDNHTDDNIFYLRRMRMKRVISLILLPVLLVGIEWAIVGVARARALDIEGGTGGGTLFYGFILLSMALPLIAGYFKWDSEQHGKLYENTLNYYHAKKMLHIVELSIIANKKDVKNLVEGSAKVAWKIFETFKLYKQNYNRTNIIADENLQGHYCENNKSFANEVINRFGEEVQEILLELNQKKSKADLIVVANTIPITPIKSQLVKEIKQTPKALPKNKPKNILPPSPPKNINSTSQLEDDDTFEDGDDKESFDIDNLDPMFEEAARLIVLHQQGSTSFIQRKLKLGNNRAGRLIDQLEAFGIVGAFEGSNAREVLVKSEEELDELLETLKSETYSQTPQEPIIDTPSINILDFDPLITKAAQFVVEQQKGSNVDLQTHFKIDFERSRQLLDQLEILKVVGTYKGLAPRKVLIQSIPDLKETLNKVLY